MSTWSLEPELGDSYSFMLFSEQVNFEKYNNYLKQQLRNRTVVGRVFNGVFCSYFLKINNWMILWQKWWKTDIDLNSNIYYWKPHEVWNSIFCLSYRNVRSMNLRTMKVSSFSLTFVFRLCLFWASIHNESKKKIVIFFQVFLCFRFCFRFIFFRR